LVKKGSWSLVIGGFVLGLALNNLIGEKSLLELWLARVFGIIAFGIQIWIYDSYAKAKGLKAPARLRLTFLGMSAASFTFAALDVLSYYDIFGKGVEVGAFFTSIALGSVLSLAERVIDIQQRHELWLG
jgi:hypothetical protein